MNLFLPVGCGRINGVGWVILLLPLDGSIQWGRETRAMVYAVDTSPFFRVRFTSFHSHSSLLTFFFCFFVLFDYCCSHARVFGKTLVHEFYISYSYTDWYLRFFRQSDQPIPTGL